MVERSTAIKLLSFSRREISYTTDKQHLHSRYIVHYIPHGISKKKNSISLTKGTHIHYQRKEKSDSSAHFFFKNVRCTWHFSNRPIVIVCAVQHISHDDEHSTNLGQSLSRELTHIKMISTNTQPKSHCCHFAQQNIVICSSVATAKNVSNKITIFLLFVANERQHQLRKTLMISELVDFSFGAINCYLKSKAVCILHMFSTR